MLTVKQYVTIHFEHTFDSYFTVQKMLPFTSVLSTNVILCNNYSILIISEKWSDNNSTLFLPEMGNITSL